MLYTWNIPSAYVNYVSIKLGRQGGREKNTQNKEKETVRAVVNNNDWKILWYKWKEPRADSLKINKTDEQLSNEKRGDKNYKHQQRRYY